MFDKIPSPIKVPADMKKTSFSWMASFKMKKTVKSLSRALTMKTKKSWKPNNSYKSVIYQENESVSGSYEDQSVLEQRHKDEQDQLQRRLSEERRQGIQLHQTLEDEMEQTTAELLFNFNHVSTDEISRDSDLSMLNRAGQEAKRYRQKRVRDLENASVARDASSYDELIERHGEEMLNSAFDKSSESDGTFKLDTEISLPPTNLKSDLHENKDEFAELDQLAIELSTHDYTNLNDLVRDLTQDCLNELEKARVLFRWVVAVSQSTSSSALLENFDTGKVSAHQLYRTLCSYAGLSCRIILGYSKGAGYKPGMDVTDDTFRNSWTSVAIDGTWRFVNCTWAARHVTGPKDELCHRLDEFYFLTDPEDHIYQHYPDNPNWQLLENPIKLEDFEKLPLLKSSFFNNNLDFPSSQDAVLITENSVAEVRLLAPEILAFGTVLLACDDSDAEQQPIENAVLQRIKADEVVFTVHLPKPGQYYFSVYVGDYWHPECLESACSFFITHTGAPQVSEPVSAPFPPVPYYGPTPMMEKLEMSLDSHTDPLIVSTDGKLHVKLIVHKDTKLTETFQYFDSHDGSLVETDRFVFVCSRDESSISYNIRCPEKGYYVFSVFGTDDNGDSFSLDCVYRYLVVCQSDNPSAKAFPRSFSRWQHCTLFAPLNGDLLPCTQHTFKLSVPGAEEVFLSFGEVNIRLGRTIGCDTWGGDLPTGETTSLLRVIARFPADGGSSVFVRLLEFYLAGVKETEL